MLFLLFALQPSVRKTHCNGRKHKENVRVYYQKWLEEQVQQLVDDTSKSCLTFTVITIITQQVSSTQLYASNASLWLQSLCNVRWVNYSVVASTVTLSLSKYRALKKLILSCLLRLKVYYVIKSICM